MAFHSSYEIELNVTVAAAESDIIDRCQEYASQDVNSNIDSGLNPIGGIIIDSGQVRLE